ncbi:MAG: hypothetical protein IT350_13725 [Deltaproteobacteria bacterium]|nr:hypothetical protein [Deltaproteobacteria bacterium]
MKKQRITTRLSGDVDGWRVARAVLPVVAMMAVVGTAFVALPFMPIDAVLAQGTWGAGPPSSSAIAAFATARPWWVAWKPEAVHPTVAGGIEPLVRVPRTEIHAGNPVAPTRGFGYDAAFGLLTAIRSLGSSDLVFDFRLMILVQRAAWIAALALTVAAMFALAGAQMRVVVAYASVLIVLLVLYAPERRFIPDGLIDSALAPACAIAIALVLAGVFRRREAAVPPRRAFAWGTAGGAIIGVTSMIRGELFYVGAFALVVVAVFGPREREHLARVGGAFAGLLIFPIAHGWVNLAVFGQFIAFRLQGAQNLFEPIGQYPNPFGILWDDAWAGELLKTRGLAYGSREADRFFLDEYLRVFADDPWLFARNFAQRLSDFGARFGWWLGPAWIAAPIVVTAATMRRERALSLSAASGIVASALVAFCAWTNSMPRLVAPAHAVLLVFFAAAFARPFERQKDDGTPRSIWPLVAACAIAGGFVITAVRGPDAGALRARCADGDATACALHARRALDDERSIARDVRLAPVYFDLACERGAREACAAAKELRTTPRDFDFATSSPDEIERNCARTPRAECAAWARAHRDAPDGDRRRANRMLTSMCLRVVDEACVALFDVGGRTASP